MMRGAMMVSTAVVAGLLASRPASAASSVVLTTSSGHPNATVLFNGAGFADGEAVDIYVDTQAVGCVAPRRRINAPTSDALRCANASYFLPLVATLHHTRCTV